MRSRSKVECEVKCPSASRRAPAPRFRFSGASQRQIHDNYGDDKNKKGDDECVLKGRDTSKTKAAEPQSTHFMRKLLALSSAVTCSDFMSAYFVKSFAFSHSKNLIPSFVWGS